MDFWVSGSGWTLTISILVHGDETRLELVLRILRDLVDRKMTATCIDGFVRTVIRVWMDISLKTSRVKHFGPYEGIHDGFTEIF